MLDQGREAQGQCFVEPPGARRFDDLRDVLREATAPAIVLLGKPGSEKSTLLRRLQMDQAQDSLNEGDSGSAVSFFISFNEYPRDTAPEPRDWLAQEWRQRHPGLPEFDDLLTGRRLLLLLDALNEMPHRDRADYERRIDLWRAFLNRYFAHDGNRAVFSCRSLDYSVPLTGEAVPVQQVTVRPMSEKQIRLFLQLKLPEKAETVWQELQANP